MKSHDKSLDFARLMIPPLITESREKRSKRKRNLMIILVLASAIGLGLAIVSIIKLLVFA